MIAPTMDEIAAMASSRRASGVSPADAFATTSIIAMVASANARRTSLP